MRVLHLVKTSIGATWAYRQMRELSELGVEVHVMLPSGGPLIPAYSQANITVHTLNFDLPVKTPWAWPGLFRQFRSLIKEIQPDLIHSHFVGTTLTMRMAMGKAHPLPRVFQVPGPLHLEHPLFRWGEISLAGPADYWIGSCRWTCERYLKSGIPRRSVFLSYYGTDLENFANRDTSILRGKIGVDCDTPLVGMVAFMYPPKWFLGQSRGIKGHEDLIDALALCFRRNSSIRGVFIGGAWGEKALGYEKRLVRYGQKKCGERVFFLSTRNDVMDLYPDLNVAVHPSLSENVGGAVESLLFGIPTITTNVGGFPDLVTHKKTGWSVPPRSPGFLAEAILEALANPVSAYNMAMVGQECTKHLFDVKLTSKKIYQIYQNILS